MNTNTILKEYTAISGKDLIAELIQKPDFISNPFVTKFFANYKEWKESTPVPMEKGETRGQSISDSTGAGANMQVEATLQILNYVIRGYTRYLSDVWVKKYTMNTVVMKIPLTEYVENADDIDAVTAGLNTTNKEIDYATLNISNPESERGARVTWTRNAIEDTTFEMQQEMLEGLGFAIAVKTMRVIMNTLFSIPATSMPAGAVLPISATGITWNQFVDTLAAVNKGYVQPDGTFKTYGPVDYVIMAPDVYYKMFNVLQPTNILFRGNTDAIARGQIDLIMGITIIPMSMMPEGTIYAVNSAKAIALGMRRSLKLEPIYFPERNRYGFVGTVRFATTTLFAGAVQCASISGDVPAPI